MGADDELAELAQRLGGVFTAREAYAAGMTSKALQWAVSKQRLVRLRQGVFTTQAVWSAATVDRKHVLKTLAQQKVSPGAVACGTTAALVLGLPTPSLPPPAPQLLRSRPERPSSRAGGRGRKAGALGRLARLADDEIRIMPSGIRVTSPVRTVLDCSRTWGRCWGLAIADAVVAGFAVEPADLVAAARARPPAPGTSRAVWVAEHARAKVESPVESLARGTIVLGGLPEPTPQVWTRTRLGRFRVDLLDEQNRLVTEADGRVKYEQPEDLWAEKRREDALREAGFKVIRFTLPDYRERNEWLRSYARLLR